MERICKRERCPISFVGIVSGTGYVTLVESAADFANYEALSVASTISPFNMHLKDVLGEMPRKTYNLDRVTPALVDLSLPTASVSQHLQRVLSVLSVGSKRFLTNKVDRCVTGLISQQQCVGPLHTPLSDYAVTAISHFGFEGIATSIGTQPLKGLINASAGARMSVAEAISNLVFVRVSDLADVKCSGNWMWAAKLPGEGAKMYDACTAMCKIMSELGIAVDGGKDSLSMAARVNDATIKSPGTLVISTYVQCPDIRMKITPDLKSPQLGRSGELIWVNIEGKFRMGGSVLAQSYGQQGNDTADIQNAGVLKAAFNVTQNLLAQRKLLAGHDISDGGLVVCLLEMAFAGLCGLRVDLSEVANLLLPGVDAGLALLFAEECGWVLEVATEDLDSVLNELSQKSVPAYHIGQSMGTAGYRSTVEIACNGVSLLVSDTLTLFKQWERTSFELEKLQMNKDCAIEEFSTYEYRTGPRYSCTFNVDAELMLKSSSPPVRVAVIREEGTNGDREMLATLLYANFEVHDVTMEDLLQGRTSLDRYRGVVFPGKCFP